MTEGLAGAAHEMYVQSRTQSFESEFRLLVEQHPKLKPIFDDLGALSSKDVLDALRKLFGEK
jgi:hypothetical protein